MSKKFFHIFLISLSILGAANQLFAQVMDSTAITVEAAEITDTLVADADTLIVSAPDSIIVSDTNYYSLYGHLFHVNDTQKVEFWTYDLGENNQIRFHHYDSTLNNLYLDHPAYKYSINNNYLGNTGLATESNLYFEQHPKSKFLFAQAYSTYYFHANQATYYNVRQPFTTFGVSMSTKEEQNLNVLHTQNVNPYFNFFLHFKGATGEGVYQMRESRNNATNFGFSYTKGPLATHANIAFNKVSAEESGGILDTRMVKDTTLDPNTLGNKITDGLTTIKNRQFFLDQKLGFVRANVKDSSGLGTYWFSLQYNYQWDKSLKEYSHTTDVYTNPYNAQSYQFYANNYSDELATFDSSSFITHENVFRLNLEEVPGKYPGFGAYFSIGLNKEEYYYFNKDSLFNNSKTTLKKSQYLEAGIYRLKSKYLKFNGLYRMYTSGYRQGDFSLKGNVFQDFGKDKYAFVLNVAGELAKNTPDYFIQDYYSNHFRWNNNFGGTVNTTLKANIVFPALHTEAGWRNELLSNYVYFDADALPKEYDQSLNVFDIYLKNRLYFSKFQLVTQLDYQNSGNQEVLPVPEFTYYGALLFEHLINFHETGGLMKVQLGTDVLYWTSFYAQEYIPSLATFVNQQQETTGDYPFWGAFASFEIKRMRFYFRFEHLNYTLSDRNYFMSPGYPTRRFNIRYGLIWTFYN